MQQKTKLEKAAGELAQACEDLCLAAFSLREGIAMLDVAAGKSATTIEIMAYRQKRRTG